jgi:hypothetical protein
VQDLIQAFQENSEAVQANNPASQQALDIGRKLLFF